MLSGLRIKIYHLPIILYNDQFPVFTVKVRHYLAYITLLAMKCLSLRLHLLNNQYFKNAQFLDVIKCCLLKISKHPNTPELYD